MTADVDTPELTALVPDLVARHPHCSWTMVAARAPGDTLAVELHAKAWPDRVAKIEVTSGGTVFFLWFAGELVGPDFGYEDDEKIEALEDVIATAAALSTGPTRIRRGVADGLVLTTSITLDPAGPGRLDLGVSCHHPVEYLKARLRGRVTHEVTDLPALHDV